MLRKWWFWVIIVMGLIIIVGSALTISVKARQEAQALEDFWETFALYMAEERKQEAIWEEFALNTEKAYALSDKMAGLRAGPKLKQLAEEHLDMISKSQEILGRIRKGFYIQSAITIQLDRDVVRITDPTKKSIAQDIADKKRELINLKLEVLTLRERDARYTEEVSQNTVLVSQGRLSMRTLNEAIEKRNETISEISERLGKIQNDQVALEGQILGLTIEKMGSTGNRGR